MPISDLSQMIGKLLLVGIRYLDESGEVADRLQFAGVVTSIDPLVAISRHEDSPFTLPPEREAFDIGEEGEYGLQTGEVVVDPDFVTTWTVAAPSR